MKLATSLPLGLSLGIGACALVLACGSKDTSLQPDDAGDAGGLYAETAPPAETPLFFEAGADARLSAPILVPNTACKVTIETPPLLCDDVTLKCGHVSFGVDVMYNSEPPSSGDHYPVWAAYQTWQHPLDYRNLVHNLEHGAIAFLYHCTQASGCDDYITGLQAASKMLFDDPVCARNGSGVRVRTLVAPDPKLTTPVVAVAWGWIYRAECLDIPSLVDFARLRYGKGPETNCQQGEMAL
jgi:hypothetical protein